MTRLLYSAILFFATLGYLSAQGTFQPKQLDSENKGIVYNQEFAVGLRIHTNGFALGLDIGKLKTYYLTHYLHFEIGELKHDKETRQSFDRATSPNGKVARAFKFGKQNNFYVLRAGVGAKRYFSEKAKRKGVAIGLSYEIGASLGLLKPYYLEVYQRDSNIPITTKYSERTADRFLEIWAIHGASNWTTGLDELSLRPGGHAQFAVHFDWGAFDEYLKALEVGVMVDAFAQKVPIMVEIDGVENSPLFLNLFLNLQFGKRW